MDNNVQTPSAAETPAAPRVLAGLQAGRIVNYVMKNGDIRPMLIIALIESAVANTVRGIVFHDGSGDVRNFPLMLLAGPSGHVPDHVALVNAPFDDDEELPGTWHWPTKQPVIAASVDNGNLELLVTGLMSSVLEQFKAELLALVNAKCDVLSKSVGDALDGHDAKVLAALRQPEPAAIDNTASEIAKRAGETVNTLAQGYGAEVAQAGEGQQQSSLETPPTGAHVAEAGPKSETAS
jgi:hypothetical protein